MQMYTPAFPPSRCNPDEEIQIPPEARPAAILKGKRKAFLLALKRGTGKILAERGRIPKAHCRKTSQFPIDSLPQACILIKRQMKFSFTE